MDRSPPLGSVSPGLAAKLSPLSSQGALATPTEHVSG